MSEISPFELKNILIELADESARKSTHIMLNAGREIKLDQYGSTGGILPIRAVRLGGMPAETELADEMAGAAGFPTAKGSRLASYSF